jgi:putative nucleotidyltransferase with HDIG domain
MEEQNVSRVRAKKTRSREKQAARTDVIRKPLHENPAIGMLIALAVWAGTLFIVRAEKLLGGTMLPQDALALAGDGAILLATLLATGMFLAIVQPDILKRNKDLLMLGAITLLSISAGKGVHYLFASTGLLPASTAQFLLPLAMAPLLATILINSPVAIAVGTWASLTMAITGDHNFVVFVTGLIVTLVTARLAWRVRTRSRVVRVGLIAGLCQVACVFGTSALGETPAEAMSVVHMAGACVVSGFFSALIVLLILPLFETAWSVTTDITLLELSDLGHPLLQRLALEAPGTYHHSLIVANLAQAAADEIGANSLLARVASYFHDIGKLTKPSFFAENIQLQANPHDDIPPSMSTLVISAHVKEGLSLAMIHKLPRPVRSVICEHHGTSVMSYFHQKAKAQLEDAATQDTSRSSASTPNKFDDGAFRYSGPRPSSKESAIICIADGLEAASRTVEKATPQHLEGLVNDITNIRIEDGQLENSGLTFGELSRIKRSFAFTLTNMLHGRVPYPKDEDRDKQPPKTRKAPVAGTEEAGAEPDDTGAASGTDPDVA